MSRRPGNDRAARLAAAWSVVLLALLRGPEATAAPPPSGAPAAAPRDLAVATIFGSELEWRTPMGFKWSPDGTRVAFLQREAPGQPPILRVHDVRAGATRMLATSEQDPNRLAFTAFEWSPGSDALVAAAGGDLYVVAPPSDGAAAPPRRLTQTDATEKDARFSPDGSKIGFVRDGDLFVIDLASGRERRLTEGGGDDFLNGDVDWVYGEEFDLRTAWWWAPGSDRLAYLQFDQRPVPRYPIVDWIPTHPALEWQHYPKAGDHNALVRVGIVQADAPPQPGAAVPPTRFIDDGGATDLYVPRVAWARDGRHLLVQHLDRDQVHLDLMRYDVATGAPVRLIEESDPFWINVGDDWRPLGTGGRDAGFIWGSERDGYRHLYLYAEDGRLVRRLTQGPWVVSSLSAVDEKAGWVYFAASEKDPLERHLYRVKLDGGGMQRLTREDGWHETWVSESGTWVDSRSTASAPPVVSIHRPDGAVAATLDEGIGKELAGYRLGRVTFEKVPAADGASLPAIMLRPHDFDPARKYPVLVYVYGGPGVQNVRDQWPGARGLWHHMLSERGVIVWTLDNRGSAGRGHAWEAPIYKHMARRELADQLEGIAWLKKQPYVDASRIGIWGWSYGGYMTLYALFNAPDIFKAGVAVAPVTDWRDYDTIYTERYMDKPEENADGYRDSSPLNQATSLKAPLLLVHGSSDDNVHVQNSVQLLDALVGAGRPVEFMLYPRKNHGIPGKDARTHLFEKITRFLAENL